MLFLIPLLQAFLGFALSPGPPQVILDVSDPGGSTRLASFLGVSSSVRQQDQPPSTVTSPWSEAFPAFQDPSLYKDGAPSSVGTGTLRQHGRLRMK